MKQNVLVLFDIDTILMVTNNSQNALELISRLRNYVSVGVISNIDSVKRSEIKNISIHFDCDVADTLPTNDGMDFKEIHFFGDISTNQCCVINNEKVIKHHIEGADDTIEYINKMISELENAYGIIETPTMVGGETNNNNKEVEEAEEVEEVNDPTQYYICEDDKGNMFKVTKMVFETIFAYGFGVTCICPNCKVTELQGDYNDMKDCEKCKKIVCMNCVALTGCQTTWGICKKCFDYKCRVCKIMDLERDEAICYLDDSKPLNVCDACKVNLYK